MKSVQKKIALNFSYDLIVSYLYESRKFRGQISNLRHRVNQVEGVSWEIEHQI